MKKQLLSFAGAALLGATISVSIAAPGDVVPGRYIVEVAGGGDARAVAARHGVNATYVYSKAVNGFAGQIPPGILARLQNDPAVRSIAPDRVVSLVQKGKPGGGGGGGTTSTEVVPAGVKRIEASPSHNLGVAGAGVGVAILDTGIDLQHADLKPNLSSVSFGGRFRADGQDDHGHGTHVAGTVAAARNTIDVVGVAPQAGLYAVKVLDASGSGYDSDVLAGLEWVAENATLVTPNIRVINMSLGRPESANDPHTCRTAIQNLVASGVTVVVAAGNDARTTVEQQVPAGYPEVISVASTTALTGSSGKVSGRTYQITQDTASHFTTDGVSITISAPGEDQENVQNGGMIQSVDILSTRLGGGATRMSGTSMAAPHVAGVVALMWEQALFNGIALDDSAIRARLKDGVLIGSAPKDSPTSSYSFDGVREGVVSAKKALGL